MHGFKANKDALVGMKMFIQRAFLSAFAEDHGLAHG
jgi:hypothetical protein